MEGRGALLERLTDFVKEKYPLPVHLIRTVWWLEQLCPTADEPLRVAALLHDIDRLFPLEPGESVPVGYRFDDPESLLWHGRRSARFASRILRDHGAGEALIRRAVLLISCHEVGGDDRADALMDADSLSFLENNVGFFLRKITAETASVRKKVDFMFSRIRSPKARELGRPLYQRVVEKLEAVVPGSIEADGSLDEAGVPVLARPPASP